MTLECEIIGPAREVDSTFDIIWIRLNNNMEVRSVRNISGSLLSDYSDLYTIPVLRRSDAFITFQCFLIINLDQPVNRSASIYLGSVSRKFKRIGIGIKFYWHLITSRLNSYNLAHVFIRNFNFREK